MAPEPVISGEHPSGADCERNTQMKRHLVCGESESCAHWKVDRHGSHKMAYDS